MQAVQLQNLPYGSHALKILNGVQEFEPRKFKMLFISVIQNYIYQQILLI
jgi:hypothetical protein